MRYKYQEMLPEIGEKGHKELLNKNIAIAGIGGVGSILAEMFTRAGIGLRLIDKDRIYLEDIQRQAMFSEEHLNKFKAKEAKKHLAKINPKLKIKTFHEQLIPHNTYLLDAELAIDCSNDFETSEIIEKHCTKVPLIYCRYSGKEAIIYRKDNRHNLKAHMGRLQKLKPIPEAGILTSTTYLAAAIIFSEAIKSLLKKKNIIRGLIHADSWANKLSVKK